MGRMGTSSRDDTLRPILSAGPLSKPTFYSSLVWHNDPFFTPRVGGKEEGKEEGRTSWGVTAVSHKKACSLCAVEWLWQWEPLLPQPAHRSCRLIIRPWVLRGRAEMQGSEKGRATEEGWGVGGGEQLFLPAGCSAQSFTRPVQPAQTNFAGTKWPFCSIFQRWVMKEENFLAEKRKGLFTGDVFFTASRRNGICVCVCTSLSEFLYIIVASCISFVYHRTCCGTSIKFWWVLFVEPHGTFSALCHKFLVQREIVWNHRGKKVWRAPG